MKLVVGHLYPDLLNLYGDRGNIITFQKRCEWRGIECEVKQYVLGDEIDFDELDIILLGGGSDREQNLVCDELRKNKEGFFKYIEENKVLLAICGGYQLLGNYYYSNLGKIPGLEIINIYTESGKTRLIGNVAIESEIEGRKIKIVGFENHAGRTYINDVQPLGKVIVGNGNNAEDGNEGIRYKNVFGTYLHGPILPKNPELADYLLKLALQNKGEDIELSKIDDSMEILANTSVLHKVTQSLTN